MPYEGQYEPAEISAGEEPASAAVRLLSSILDEIRGA